MEKLQTVDSCIIHDVCRIHSMLRSHGAGDMAKEICTRLESGRLYSQTTKDVLRQPAAVFYAHNNKSSNAAKTIEIRYYVVKDKIQDQTISLEHIRTKDMLADPLTKGLPPNVFKEHLAGMGLRESLMIPG